MLGNEDAACGDYAIAPDGAYLREIGQAASSDLKPVRDVLAALKPARDERRWPYSQTALLDGNRLSGWPSGSS